MNKIEHLRKFDFHDSLLESISYDNDNKKIFLKIDFCNWKQEWYNESDEETSMISIVFNNASNLSIPNFSLNSDEIIEFDILSDNSVKMVVFNDIDNTSYEIIIRAQTVEIIK